MTPSRPTTPRDYVLRYGLPKNPGQDLPLFLPTEHRPGSREKVNVLRYRAEHGLPLWHPDDNPIPIEPPNPGKSQ